MSAINSLMYAVFSWALVFALTILFRLRCTGQRNLPRTGPVLIVANHQSFLDPPALGCGRRRHWHFLARKTLLTNRWTGWLLRRLNTLPVDQEGIGIEGIRAVVDSLARGRVVLIFPEGERTHDGRLQEFKAGIALLFRKLDFPVVPAAIVGAYDAWPRWRKFPIPSPIFLPPTKRAIAVAFGRPRNSATLRALPRDEMLAQLQADVQELMKRAESLLGRPGS